MTAHRELQGLAVMWDAVRFAYTVFGYIVWDWGADPFGNHWVPLYTVPAHLIVQYLRAHPDVSYSVLALLDTKRSSDLMLKTGEVVLMPPPGDIGHTHTPHDPRYKEGRAVFPNFIEKTILEALDALNVQVEVSCYMFKRCLKVQNGLFDLSLATEAIESLVTFEPSRLDRCFEK